MDLLKGTLDVLILKTLSWGPSHGYAVSKSIRTQTSERFNVEEGALYPALRRLEKKGMLEAEWVLTDTGREAKSYTLTAQGVRHLEKEVASWAGYVDAMSCVLTASGPGA